MDWHNIKDVVIPLLTAATAALAWVFGRKYSKAREENNLIRDEVKIKSELMETIRQLTGHIDNFYNEQINYKQELYKARDAAQEQQREIARLLAVERSSMQEILQFKEQIKWLKEHCDCHE